MDFLVEENKLLREKLNNVVAAIAGLKGEEHAERWNAAIDEALKVAFSELGGTAC